MTKKIVAVVGEYVNQQGEQKAEYCDIGVINFSQNGKEYALIDPSVSLAGVLAKQNALAAKRGEQPRNMIMCSVFERQQNQGGGYAPQQQGGYAQQQGYSQPQQNYQQPQQNYQQPPRQQHQQSNSAPNRSQPAPMGDSFDDD